MQRKSSSEPVEKQIAKHYTRSILTGELPAGAQLPSNRHLAEKWSTSCSSVQRALAQLTAAGLIERATSRGTFVRGRQNRALVGILIGPDLVDNVSWYYRALQEALHDEIDSEYLSCRVYAGLSQPTAILSPKTVSQLKHLEIDRKYFNFAGYIEVATAEIAPAARVSNVPRVVFDVLMPENDVDYDYADCGREIVASLKARRQRKTWVISTHLAGSENNSGGRKHAAILAELAAQALPPPLSLRIPLDRPGSVLEAQMHDAMMAHLSSVRKGQWPQAIIVTDDVAMRALILALLKYGIKIPDDLELYVITAENTSVYYSVPVHAYSFPTRAVAVHLAALLKARMAGEKEATGPALLKGAMITCL